MITRELPQYADIVRRLTPALAGLPPKLIAIDGPMSSGKTTLGRHLAWRFKVTLVEADLFAVPRSKPIGHKNIQHTVRYTEPAPDRFKDFGVKATP
jgi:tRNA A37 threonylcarbamoyladenosine biosynthesis protein TsaE